MLRRQPISRRTFLRGTGVALSLPMLEAMVPSVLRAATWAPPRRLLAINIAFGLHAPYLFPTTTGRDYEATRYLDVIGDFRDDFTLFSGLSHPEVDGGHPAEASFLTAAPHPASGFFKNSISLDQVIAEEIGSRTRFAHLPLTTGQRGMAFSRSGVEIPAESSPSRLFAKLFVAGSPEEQRAQLAALRNGQSVMDTVREAAARLVREVGTTDRDRLDGYFTSVRETEQRLVKAEEWMNRPKPTTTAEPPVDIAERADVIGRVRLMYDMAHLALASDSTRVITLKASGQNLRPPIDGVDMDYHNLSHHGKVPDKIEQLAIIEMEHMKAFRDLLTELRGSAEEGGSLLDHTMVFLGSNLGNASSHNNKNLPIILAGGGFRHGRHVAFDPENNAPLPNLFVAMLHRLGIEQDRFASSTGTLPGLEMA
jgi:hypothetical protein